MTSRGILSILPPDCTKSVIFLVTTKKFSSDLGNMHFQIFSPKCRKCKIRLRGGHGKLRNGHGQIYCQVCGYTEVKFYPYKGKKKKVCGGGGVEFQPC